MVENDAKESRSDAGRAGHADDSESRAGHADDSESPEGTAREQPLIYDTRLDEEAVTDLEHLDAEQVVEDAIEYFSANPSESD